MLIIPRGEYDPNKHIAEGDLVSIDWHDNSLDVGIRNDDHLCPSEEVLVAEVYLSGNLLLFDEEDLTVIEKCKQ